LIIVDDVSPLATLAGVLGVVAAVLGLVGLVASLFLSRTGFSRLVSMIVGLLAGLGVGAWLQQTAILDPGTSLGLLFPLGGAVIGLFVPGVLRRPSVAAP
jgi:apolipoprotein N-acyltransferase